MMDNTEALRLRPPRHRVSGRAVWWWTTRSLVVVLPTIATPAVSMIFVDVQPARMWLLIVTGTLALLGLLVTVVMPQWRYRVHRWEITDTAVYTSSGWIWQEWRVAPMSRVQTVDTARGPLQRLFGLSSVTVTTASAAGPIEISGLDHTMATEVADQLTESTEATSGDAT